MAQHIAALVLHAFLLCRFDLFVDLVDRLLLCLADHIRQRDSGAVDLLLHHDRNVDVLEYHHRIPPRTVDPGDGRVQGYTVGDHFDQPGKERNLPAVPPVLPDLYARLGHVHFKQCLDVMFTKPHLPQVERELPAGRVGNFVRLIILHGVFRSLSSNRIS